LQIVLINISIKSPIYELSIHSHLYRESCQHIEIINPLDFIPEYGSIAYW